MKTDMRERCAIWATSHWSVEECRHIIRKCSTQWPVSEWVSDRERRDRPPGLLSNEEFRFNTWEYEAIGQRFVPGHKVRLSDTDFAAFWKYFNRISWGNNHPWAKATPELQHCSRSHHDDDDDNLPSPSWPSIRNMTIQVAGFIYRVNLSCGVNSPKCKRKEEDGMGWDPTREM